MSSYKIKTFAACAIARKRSSLDFGGMEEGGGFRSGSLDEDAVPVGCSGSSVMLPGAESRGRAVPAEGAAGPREARPAPHLPGITGPASSLQNCLQSKRRPPQPRPPVRGAARHARRNPPGSRLTPRSRRELPGGPAPGVARGLRSLPARPGPAGAAPQVRGAGRGGAARLGGQWATVGGAGPGVKRAGIHERRAKLGLGSRGSRAGSAAVRPGMPAGRQTRRGSGGPRGPRR